jgi:hypothetical protein
MRQIVHGDYPEAPQFQLAYCTLLIGGRALARCGDAS